MSASVPGGAFDTNSDKNNLFATVKREFLQETGITAPEHLFDKKIQQTIAKEFGTFFFSSSF